MSDDTLTPAEVAAVLHKWTKQQNELMLPFPLAAVAAVRLLESLDAERARLTAENRQLHALLTLPSSADQAREALRIAAAALEEIAHDRDCEDGHFQIANNALTVVRRALGAEA